MQNLQQFNNFRLADADTTVGACDEETKKALTEQSTQLETTKTKLNKVKNGN